MNIVSYIFDRGTKENLMGKEKSSTNGAGSPGQAICICEKWLWTLISYQIEKSTQHPA